MNKVRFSKPDFYIDVENRIRHCCILKIRTSPRTLIQKQLTTTHMPLRTKFSRSPPCCQKEERIAVVIRKNHFYLHYATVATMRLEYMIKLNYKYHCMPVVTAVFVAAFLFISMQLRTRQNTINSNWFWENVL